MATSSAYLEQPVGTSGSGLDQLLGWIARDGGLAGANDASSIAAGIAAVDGLNQLLVAGLAAIGRLESQQITVEDVKALNAWIRDPAAPERLALFTALHGDDANGVETGFHTIQGDGGQRKFDGKTLIDTVLDGIFHVGFAISADGTRLTNEDGADNAALTDVARWLTLLKTDLATTGSGLDRIVETIVADAGLQAAISTADIGAGAAAANSLDGLILEGLDALKQAGAADGDNTRLSEAELLWINSWIRQDPDRLARFTALHGDDEQGLETGFHLVQNDGATTRLFGQNAVNTIYDGIFHVGFSVNADGRFVNEDGAANARVSDVAEWITYYYGDPSTTGTGLDRLVDWMQLDSGLARNTAALDINHGLAAANGLNAILLEAIDATGVNLDGYVSRGDLRAINQWVVEHRYDAFLALHGDDDNGVETGFHLIQGDGGSTQFFGRNLVNTVADGIYHFGFAIQGENFLNEDGAVNQSLSDVSGWVNAFLNNTRLTTGTWDADVLIGNDDADQILAYGGNDLLSGEGGADLLDGGWGKDTLYGGLGDDQLDGGYDGDLLDGGEGSDLYLVRGAGPEWIDGVPYTFEGYDTYADSGSGVGEVDRILAEGDGPVDIGFLQFSAATSGIEEIVNGTEGGQLVRLLGNWQANSLDFSGVLLQGGNVLVDAGDGKDTVVGSSAADRIRGGGDSDWLNGGAGSDTYEVRGAGPEWIDGVPYTFEGYDTYADSGSGVGEVDRILAEGDGAVDIGFLQFSAATSGIEEIVNGTEGGQLVRLLGNWQANSLDFSGVLLQGGNVLVDAGDGKDTVVGSSAADRIRGGGDSDWLNGGAGSDTYEVRGAGPEWIDGVPYTFEGYDTYADSGSGVGEVDRILVMAPLGTEAVDIGLRNFGPNSGIESIDASATSGSVRLLGDWQANAFDFTGVSLIGSNVSIDVGSGNDTVVGSAAADTILGGSGTDFLNGAGGGDTYLVGGSAAGGFQGNDTYADSGNGAGEVDRIVVTAGTGAVDIGLVNFSSSSGIEQIDGTATSGAVRLLGDSSANTLNFTGVSLIGSNVSIDVGSGNDTVVGSAAADTILGGSGTDFLNGAGGGDTYLVGGSAAGGFQGNDTYADSGNGAGEVDRIVVTAGTGAVDIGLVNFSSSSGIEQIDGTATSGAVRLLGDSSANTLNFTGVSLIGSNVSIDVGSGNDTVVGSAAADTILGGSGTDFLNGAGGGDTYLVGGSAAGGFQGNDTYADSGNGTGEVDRIVVTAGTGAVDIGLVNFSSSSGIEQIDGTATSGAVRLLGDSSANTLNFTGVSLIGSNVSIDVGSGNDTVVGSAAADTILGGSGTDFLNGADGADAITGGSGLDTLTGGLSSDLFGYTTLTDAIVGGTSTLRTFERITDFKIGEDRFDVTTVPVAGAFKTLGSVSSLSNTALTTLLNTTNFVANGAATFTYGSGASTRTFVAFNNATAGFSASTDAIVEITGYSYASGYNALTQIGII